MADPIAVVKASPLILLGRIERLDLLRLAGRTLVPQAVFDEVSAKDPGQRLALALACRPWLERAPLLEPSPAIHRLGLGGGESIVALRGTLIPIDVSFTEGHQRYRVAARAFNRSWSRS